MTVNVFTSSAIAGDKVESDEVQFLNIMNNYRVSKGLKALTMDADIALVSNRHAIDINENLGVQTHNWSIGGWADGIKKFFPSPGAMGENIYIHPNIHGFTLTAQQAFDGFKNSPSHNSAMLSGTYTHVGVAEDQGGWVIDFAAGDRTVSWGTSTAPVSPPPPPPAATTSSGSTWGTAGNDARQGGAGNDNFYGQAGNDSLLGGAGDDRMSGNTGNDQVSGQDGNDVLFGNENDDRLDGGNGNDNLVGGAGRDTLIGGAGADVFCYAKGDGTDTVNDFQSVDRLQLTSLAKVAVQDSGANAVLNFGNGDLVTVLNVDHLQLKEWLGW